jgi:hypothetical protein
MHRLRIELGGEGANFLDRDVAWSETAQRARLKVLENKRVHGRGHLSESPIVAALCGNLNPIHFAWFAFDLPELPFGASHLLNETDRTNHIRPGRRKPMFDFQDLFQWDRFITPTIIKTFYWLVIALICLFGIAGIFSGLAAMAISPFGGFIQLLSSIASVFVGVIFSRIAAEFILIVFRINEHLGAIRDQGAGH